MPRKPVLPPPTEEEIMGYANVPAELAARYIGWSSTTIYRALQEERAPFGFAVRCTGNWAYNISPGLLVRYKRGDLPTYHLEEVQSLAVEGIERVINTKLSDIRRALEKAAAL